MANLTICSKSIDDLGFRINELNQIRIYSVVVRVSGYDIFIAAELAFDIRRKRSSADDLVIKIANRSNQADDDMGFSCVNYLTLSVSASSLARAYVGSKNAYAANSI